MSDIDSPVTLDIAADVATVTLDSPSTRNALSSELLANLLDAITNAGKSESRVIVLTHTSNIFCSGLDLKKVADGEYDLRGLAKVILALREVRQPTIAVLSGAARAGGLGIMAACDMVVVAPTVNFAFTEVKIGAVPATVSVPILARVSWSNLVAPFITGEVFDAHRALEIGLVSHVSEDPHATAKGLVDSVCAAGPQAVAATTRILRGAASDAYEKNLDQMRQLSEHVFVSDEAKEGIAAFLEKRPASWRL